MVSIIKNLSDEEKAIAPCGIHCDVCGDLTNYMEPNGEDHKLYWVPYFDQGTHIDVKTLCQKCTHRWIENKPILLKEATRVELLKEVENSVNDSFIRLERQYGMRQ
jgi:C4-type Zn-finger protein